MHNKTKMIIMLLLAVIFTACASIPDPPDYDKILPTWVGSPVDKLILSWGPPHSTYPLSNGGRVIQYVRHISFSRGGNTIYMPVTRYTSGSVIGPNGQIGLYSGSYQDTEPIHFPKKDYNLMCKITFHANENDRIIDWQTQGNHCKKD